MNLFLLKELSESKDKIKELEEENNTIKVEYEKLTKQKEEEMVALKNSTNSNISTLINCAPELDKLRIENEGLKVQLGDINIEYAKILEENEKFREKIIKLKLCQSSDEEELKDSKLLNQQLYRENEVLKAEQTKIKDESKKLINEIVKLKEQINSKEQKPYPNHSNRIASNIIENSLNSYDDVEKEVKQIHESQIKQCKVILHDFKKSKCGKRQCFLKTLKKQDKFWVGLNSSRIFGPFSCNRCPNSLTSKYLLKRHISEVHKASKRNRSSEAMDPQSGQHNVKHSFRNKYGTSGITLDIVSRLYRCNHCSFVSETRYDGQKHVTKKHGAKILFSCDHCDQKYMDKCALKIHMDSVIKGEGGKYRCNFCEFKACKEYGLWKHKESEHKIGTKRGKKCNLCGKVFSHLKRHIMTVHERRKDLKCEKCGKSFDKNYNLRQHQRKCH